MPSQRFEPLDKARRKSSFWCLRSVRAVHQIERFTFHLEISLHVDIGGLHVHMAKEILHHHERNAGLKQVHSLGVPHGMGADASTRQGGHGTRGAAQILKENVASAMSAQGGPAPVLKQGLLVIETTPAGREKLADELSRLRQQGAQTFTPSFAA